MKDKIDFYYFTMTPKVPILQGGIINIKKIQPSRTVAGYYITITFLSFQQSDVVVLAQECFPESQFLTHR